MANVTGKKNSHKIRKLQRFDSKIEKEEEIICHELENGVHPFNIEPFGNRFFSRNKDLRHIGLGFLKLLKDDQIIDLLGYLKANDLGYLAQTSHALRIYCYTDQLWKALFLNEATGAIQFVNNWRTSYIVWKQGEACGDTLRTNATQLTALAGALKVPGSLFSDFLFHAWTCATAKIEKSWIEVENVDRREALSTEEFIREYEKPNQPVIITDVVTKWPAFSKWKPNYLWKTYGEIPFHAGGFNFKLKDYFSYSRSSVEDQPLYIFDKHFGKKAPGMLLDYSVPEYFSEDLFSLLGEERPDFRWLIIGPQKSGSSFHKDPNCTSAWNAVIRGKKKWILFPPEFTPPGVYPSEDGLELATPVCLIEWFLQFYRATKNAKVCPKECVVSEGEIIFVPRGWWHMVLNLEESIAITQNYVSSTNLGHVLSFLKDKPHLISGLPNDKRLLLHHTFYERLKDKLPELIERTEKEIDENSKSIINAKNKCRSYFNKDDSQSAQSSHFSFGFNL